MNKFKKIIIEIHNASGSLMSLMFVFWCISGIVLTFDGFPHASRRERFDFLETFNTRDFEGLKAPPSDFKGKFSLELCDGQPVYRVKKGRKGQTVYDAHTLEAKANYSLAFANETASTFIGSEVATVEYLEHLDNWMPWAYYCPLLPIYKCAMADERHTTIYVSAVSGTIVQQTDRPSRWSARFGAIPHWVYFKRLKLQEDKWRTVIIILSSLGILMSLMGIFAGVFRLNKRGKKGLTPYKKWWYKWHHFFGFFFGLFVFTFILSGLISVTSVPDWMVGVDADQKTRITWNQKLSLSDYPAVTPQEIAQAVADPSSIRKIEWVKAMNELQFHIYTDDYQKADIYYYHDGQVLKRPLSSVSDIQAFAKNVAPELEYDLSVQEEYDVYYSGSAMWFLPIPAYKLSFNDEEKTCLYVNPANGKRVFKHNKQYRARRWLYRFLHTLDLPVLKKYDVLRKGLLVVLCLGCLVVSVSGVVLSFKYFRRQVKRASK